jgi:hypothetical protein
MCRWLFSSLLSVPASIVKQQIVLLCIVTVYDLHCSSATTLTHVIPRGNYPVVGVTCLASELFVVRQTPQQRIEVYDTTTFTQQRSISVSQLDKASGLTSCVVNMCLYVSDHGNDRVHKVEMSDSSATSQQSSYGYGYYGYDKVKKATTYWNVGVRPAGLCVTSVNNVLVTCNIENSVREYTTQGKMVRRITFQSVINSPWHVIQFSNDQFAVTFSHGVRIVNGQGKIVHSCGNTYVCGSAPGQVNNPKSLMQVNKDCILVADCNNNRMMLFSSTSNRTLEIALPTDGGLQGPWGFFLDIDLGRLFVGEYEGNRVFVFDNVYSSL